MLSTMLAILAGWETMEQISSQFRPTESVAIRMNQIRVERAQLWRLFQQAVSYPQAQPSVFSAKINTSKKLLILAH